MSTTVRTRQPVERVHPPHWLLRVVNPVVRAALQRGRPEEVAGQIALLHFTGRRSGKGYSVPAGCRLIQGRTAVLTSSGWRVNFRGGQDFEVTLKGVRRRAHGELVEDPAQVVAVGARGAAAMAVSIGARAGSRPTAYRNSADKRVTRE